MIGRAISTDSWQYLESAANSYPLFNIILNDLYDIISSSSLTLFPEPITGPAVVDYLFLNKRFAILTQSITYLFRSSLFDVHLICDTIKPRFS